MDCGLVLEALLGLGGDETVGPGVIWEGGEEERRRRRRRRNAWTIGRGGGGGQEVEEEREEGGGVVGWRRRGKDTILHLLSQFNLDSDQVGQKAWEKFEKIYERRRREKKLQGSGNREKVALVFAIATTLNEEKIPRPISHIANVCGLPPHHLRRVLKINKTLKLEKKACFSDAHPRDYVSALCAYLQIPFSVGQQSERMLDREEIKWGLFGHRPQHLAAAVVEKVLIARGMSSRLKDLCRELACGEGSVNQILMKIPSHLCTE